MPYAPFHILSGGNEGASLIFVNSLGADLRSWDMVFEMVEEDPDLGKHPLLRYDQRGHGRSESTQPPYSIVQLSEDLSSLIDTLGFEKVAVIGVSVGGMIAMHYTAMNPERVEALIVCDTAPRIGTSDGWNERIDTLRQHGMTFLADAILARWFAPEFSRKHPATYARSLEMLAQTSVDGYAGVCEAIRDADLTDFTGRITAPTLVICGEHDVATTPAMCRQLADSIAGAQFELISDAAHLPMVEQPVRFFEIVRLWLTDSAFDQE